MPPFRLPKPFTEKNWHIARVELVQGEGYRISVWTPYSMELTPARSRELAAWLKKSADFCTIENRKKWKFKWR
jgi:hypothetical protein